MSGTSKRLTLRCGCCTPTITTMGADLDRRRVLAGGIAALGLGAARRRSPRPAVRAQTAKTRIDVHHHFGTPLHSDVMAVRRSGGRPPKWTVQMSLEEMDKSGIATAIVSLVQPASWFPDDVPLSRKLQRECNEFAARMIQDHPGRFGQFATISPPDIENSLKEIEYSFDTLKADGVGVMTSYGKQYLGDPSYAPIYEELNRRKALGLCSSDHACMLLQSGTRHPALGGGIRDQLDPHHCPRRVQRHGSEISGYPMDLLA